MNKVAAVIPHKYEMVGLQLRLSLAELQVIGPRHPTLEEHHRACVCVWITSLQLEDIVWCAEECQYW